MDVGDRERAGEAVSEANSSEYWKLGRIYRLIRGMYTEIIIAYIMQ